MLAAASLRKAGRYCAAGWRDHVCNTALHTTVGSPHFPRDGFEDRPAVSSCGERRSAGQRQRGRISRKAVCVRTSAERGDLKWPDPAEPVVARCARTARRGFAGVALRGVRCALNDRVLERIVRCHSSKRRESKRRERIAPGGRSGDRGAAGSWQARSTTLRNVRQRTKVGGRDTQGKSSFVGSVFSSTSAKVRGMLRAPEG